MGIFDDIKGKAEGLMGGAGKDSGIIKGVMALISDQQSGGLHGLIENFRQKGMGDIVSSWISTGPNAPISAQQVREGLGDDRLQTVATHAGVSRDEAANKLSEHLPNIVDKLTPDGNVPDKASLMQKIEMLKSKFF